MAITREEFDRLVQEVEMGVGRHAAALRMRVAWLAVAGYAGFLASFLIVLLLAAVCFGIARSVPRGDAIFPLVVGVLILIVGAVVVGRELWVRLSSPEGHQLKPAEAPALFAMLKELQAQLGSAPFHVVLVDHDCNACVIQEPRLGVLGWSRNYLVLGLPLLECLSADELRAVLAHEFAHLSREHGRFGQWIYRLRRTWARVFESLSAPRAAGDISLRPVMIKFIDWFWPRFNAHAFVLSRANEYEADRLAGQFAGGHNLASALMRIALHSRQLDEKFWPDFWQLAHRDAVPPADVFLQLRDSLRAGPAPGDAAKWMGAAFRNMTNNADTHPCLRDRLRALQQATPDAADSTFPVPPPCSGPSAADVLFGPALPHIRAQVDKQWRKESDQNWRDRHAKARALSHRLATLADAVPDLAVNVDSLWDKARVVMELEGDPAATPLLHQVLALRPAHVAASYHLGRILLEAGDAAGEAHLERAVAEQDELVHDACQLLRVHYRRTGQAVRLRELDARLDRHEAAVRASHEERSRVTTSDTLLHHGLSDAELAALVAQLALDPDVFQAHLARKELRHFPAQKLFVLSVRMRPAWHRLPRTEPEQDLVNRTARNLKLPGRVLVIAPSGALGGVARKLARLAGAQIFQHRG